MRKMDKIRVIKWYIRKFIDTKQNIEIDNLNKLENIVRTEKNMFGKSSRCNGCTSDGKDYCQRCANCIEWHWDKNIKEVVDNYSFRYAYWKTFADIDIKEGKRNGI